MAPTSNRDVQRNLQMFDRSRRTIGISLLIRAAESRPKSECLHTLSAPLYNGDWHAGKGDLVSSAACIFGKHVPIAIHLNLPMNRHCLPISESPPKSSRKSGIADGCTSISRSQRGRKSTLDQRAGSATTAEAHAPGITQMRLIIFVSISACRWARSPVGICPPLITMPASIFFSNACPVRLALVKKAKLPSATATFA